MRGFTTDSDEIERAEHFLKMMIFAVDTRPKGFDSGGVVALVHNFLKFVRHFRGRGEIPTLELRWIRTETPRAIPTGYKRSQYLVRTVHRMKSVLKPGDTDDDSLFNLYVELRLQMFEFVWEFRSRLQQQGAAEVRRFNTELQGVLTFARSQWF